MNWKALLDTALMEMPIDDVGLLHEAICDLVNLYEKYPKLLKAHSIAINLYVVKPSVDGK